MCRPHEKKEVIDLLKKKENCTGNQCTEIDNQLKELTQTSEQRDKEFKGYLSACEKGNQASCAQAKAIHYDMSLKWTEEGNEYYKNHKDEFELLSHTKSVYHVNKIDPEIGKVVEGIASNTKYIHPVYGYEVVLDKNNNMVTDPINIGTYNFYNPGVLSNNLLNSGSKHTEYDVKPYEELGNSPADRTTKEQRGLPLSKLPYAIGSDIKDAGKGSINAVKDFFSSSKTN